MRSRYFEEMDKATCILQIRANEIEILRELLADNISLITQSLQKTERGEVSISEISNYEFQNNTDAEYYAELMLSLSSKMDSLKAYLRRNEVTYLEQAEIFRADQLITVYTVHYKDSQQLNYVLQTRHGVHYVYFSLSSLIACFTKGEDSQYRFDSGKEAQHFLHYWQGGNSHK
ncbi:hypothetical protein OAB00_02830 [Akkermansiaceae bacterium]|nr:hypothetical protein [Akkermansiaceae bacterium]